MTLNVNTAVSPLLYSSLLSTESTWPKIRLISIKSEPGDAELRVYLDSISLADAKSHGYYALSYVWGDATDTEAIQVNGHEFHATRNLVLALSQMAATQRHATDALWVDAICINQVDASERSSQVGIMDQIYQNAREVLCWLGPEDKSTATAMQLVKMLSRDVKDFHSSDTPSSPTEHLLFAHLENPLYLDLIRQLPKNNFMTLDLFTTRDYWTRIWTLQEMVLAGLCTLVCGQQSCYLNEMELAVDWACSQPVYDLIQADKRPPKVDPKVWNFIYWFLRGWEMNYPIPEVLSMRKDIRGSPGFHKAPSTTIKFLAQSAKRRATDPRDKLYGMAGICDIGLEIDYSISPEVLFTQFAAHSVSRIPDLSKLLQNAGTCRKFDSGRSLPSWVPDWGSHRYVPKGRFKANAGCPSHASKVEVEKDGGELRVFGICLDVISEILPKPDSDTPVQDDEDLREVARNAQFLFQQNATTILEQIIPAPPTKHRYRTGIPIVHAVLSLLLTNIDLRTREEYNPRHFEPLPPLIRCLLTESSTERGTTRATIPDTNGSDLTDTRTAETFLTEVLNIDRNVDLHVQDIIMAADILHDDWRMEQLMRSSPFMGPSRPFRTMEGYIGCASADCKAGDLICVLGASSKPVVLREVVGGSDGTFQFVSTCRVVGANDGEYS
ncbi:heterokaryon incompatibility protein-domain-containing protein [Podospora aff. communis PSN243]|uniref:Heterokaryon incompatibility protein-domain-containing protein n=1 Tax=Podospora aff. communis PSN243 TaxID=3040156 RepID=A0AAV9G7W5_9PEZI|nr:heterokaryon incompatibility protein-domain-containing protein [Podospora aff. communis PSN243]